MPVQWDRRVRCSLFSPIFSLSLSLSLPFTDPHATYRVGYHTGRTSPLLHFSQYDCRLRSSVQTTDDENIRETKRARSCSEFSSFFESHIRKLRRNKHVVCFDTIIVLYIFSLTY